MKKAYNLMIGEQTAERVKIEIGSADDDGEERTMEVRGRDMISGLPRKTLVTGDEIRESLQEPLQAIIETVTRTLERAKVNADEIKLIVPHQANIRIIQAACDRLGIAQERAAIVLDRTGNTSSASIPFAPVNGNSSMLSLPSAIALA